MAVQTFGKRNGGTGVSLHLDLFLDDTTQLGFRCAEFIIQQLCLALRFRGLGQGVVSFGAQHAEIGTKASFHLHNA